MIQSGIDEAGLGPILGPYCAGLITLEYETPGDPRKLCRSVLAGKPGKKGTLDVGDSKQIYSPGKLAPLEETVLAFCCLASGGLPEDAGAFIRRLALENAGAPRETPEAPWIRDLGKCALPLQADTEVILKKAERLGKGLENAGIRLDRMNLQVIPAAGFNRLLDRFKSKARVCQKILEPLMHAGNRSGGTLVVDRQGGRRYYGEWLVELFPGQPLAARRETAELSRYDVGGSTVDFRVGADAACFETALASMTAKYARELCMEQFNRYWSEQTGNLKPTAGYYTDGKRFLSDLKKAGVMPLETEILVRKK